MARLARLLALGVAIVAAASLPPGAAPRAERLPGLLTTKAPWPANNGATLRARLAAIGLPALKREGARLHIHQHIDLVVDGKLYRIASGIGIDARSRFISPLHTHDPTGIVHVESPSVRKYTLGQFFDVWGVRFTGRCLGAYRARGSKRVWVFVNGKLSIGNPRTIALREHQEFVVAYGTYASIPKPIPPAYPFPPGL